MCPSTRSEIVVLVARQLLGSRRVAGAINLYKETWGAFSKGIELTKLLWKSLLRVPEKFRVIFKFGI